MLNSHRSPLAAPLVVIASLVTSCLDQPFATNVDLPLQVIQLAPTDGAIGVARGTTITATFNLPVVEASLAENVVVETIADAANPIAVDGAIAYVAPDDTHAPQVVFTPAALLPYSTPVRVTLKTGIERDTEPKGNLLQQATSVFTTENPPPLAIVDIAPGNNALGVDVGTTVRITFSEPVRCATATAGIAVAETFDAHPHRGTLAGTTAPVAGTFACQEPASIEDLSCENDACVIVFTPDVPFSLSSLVTVSIAGGTRADGAVESFRATDAGGQLPTDVTSTFRIVDPPALFLLSSTPGSGATDVALDSTLTMVFSEDLDCDTVTSAITAQQTTADGITASLGIANVDCNGALVVVTFASTLAFSATIDVTVADTVESARATTRGGQLTGGALISFDTIDPPPLLVFSTTPGDGSTQVPLDGDIAIRFSEPVDCASVTSSSVSVVQTFDALVATRLGAASAPAAFTIDCVDDTVTLTLDAWQHTSSVAVALDGSIQSARATLDGGQLNDGAGTAFEFTTEDPLDLFLVNALPGNGSTGIGVNTTLTATFSEAIDCASVVAGDVVVTETFSQQFLQQQPPQSPTSTTHPVTVASCAGDTLTLDPTDDFQLASHIEVHLPGAIASARATTPRGRLSGGAGVTYSFEIVPFPPVEVVEVFPNGGLIGRTSTFRVTFNQDVGVPIVDLADPTTTQVFLALTPDASTAPDTAAAVPLVCDNCQTGQVFTFRPVDPLVDGSRYALVIRSGPQGVRGSVGGSIMLTDVIKRFLVVGGGLFVGSDPSEGDTDVPVTDRVCAVFLLDLALTPTGNDEVTNTDNLAFLDGAFALSATTPVGTQSEIPVSYSVDGVDPVTGQPDPASGKLSNRVCLTPLPATHPCSDVDELLPDNSEISLTVSFTDNRDPEAPQVVDQTITFTTGGLPTLVDSFYETIAAVNLVGELSTEVPVNGTIALVFDTDVDAATAAAHVRMTTALGAAIATTIDVDGDTVRLTPTQNLAFNTAHRIVVDGGVSGLLFTDGRYLGEDETLSFTTSPANAARISILDSENAAEVTVSPVIFDRRMFLPSLNSDTITALDNTSASTIEGGIATFIDDPFTAVFTAQPSYINGHDVTFTVTTGALDFLGNPLAQQASVRWNSIVGTSAASANPPDLVTSAKVAPNTGAVAATQTFRLALNTSANQKLINRMVPSSFNPTSILFQQTASCALGGAAHDIATSQRFTIATTTQGAEAVDIVPGETLRSDCAYRLTLKQRFFANIYLQQADAAAPDVVINVTGETVRPTATSGNITNATGGQPLTITFSEPIDVATLTARATVVDSTAGNAVVAGTWTTSGNTATFTAASFWRTGHTYTATLPTTANGAIPAVSDLAGNALQGATPVTLTLTTVTTPLVPPALVTTTNGQLVLTFPRALDPAAVLPTTFFDGNVVPGTIRVKAAGVDVAACIHASGTTVVIDQVDAAPGTPIDIVITTSVTDDAGNAVASETTLSTTAP